MEKEQLMFKLNKDTKRKLLGYLYLNGLTVQKALENCCEELVKKYEKKPD